MARRWRRGFGGRLAVVAMGAIAALAVVAATATVAGAAPEASAAPAVPASPAAPAAPRSCPPTIDDREPASAADRGLLWRVSRDGRSSYLFATLHVGRPSWRAFGPRITAAQAQTDTLALEIDPADPALAASLGADPAGAEAPALTPALRDRLARAVERACLPPAALASLHPVLQAVTLTMLDARWLGLDASYALEWLLAARARAEGREVVALESAALQRSVLVPAEPGAAQAMVEQALAQLEDQTGRRVLARLAGAWERGDLATLASYESWCECAATEEDRAFLKRLNDDRNPHLADAIAQLHRRGRRVFAAVGALHMTGPQALPALLEARGFRVERIPFAP